MSIVHGHLHRNSIGKFPDKFFLLSGLYNRYFIVTTVSSLLSVLFYNATWSEVFQKVSMKQPGPSQKQLIVLFYFRAATANFWALVNDLVWIFGKNLH